MAAATNFEELQVWRDSRALTVAVYEATRGGLFARDYAFRDQMRRASLSIVSNIAEGFERGSNREFIHFLHIAKGSAGELRAQCYLALDLKYLPEAVFNALNQQVTGVSKQLSGFIKYLEQSNIAPRTKSARSGAPILNI
jgi:four helix bundle protein